ncbi:MAG: class I tRNA ligase family protein, partial [Nitrososphaeria archaeon]
RRRTGNRLIGREFIVAWLKVLAPFIPHICEETWRWLGEQPFISTASWSEAGKEGIDTKVIGLEEILKRTMEDIKRISELTRRREKLFLYTVSEEEFRHFRIARRFLSRQFGFNEVHVFRADDMGKYDPADRARRARPRRPGIYLE